MADLTVKAPYKWVAYQKIAATLDMVAESLESRGMLTEAEQLDVIANTIEAGLFNDPNPTKEELEGLRQMISDKVRGNPGYLANKVEVTKKDHADRFLKRTEERVRTSERPAVKPALWKGGPDNHWYLQNAGDDYSVEFVGDHGFLVDNKTGDKTLVPGLEVVDVLALSGERLAADGDLAEKLPVMTDARLKSAFNTASKSYMQGIYSDDTSWAPVHELVKKLVAILPTFQLIKASYDTDRPNKSKTWYYAGAFETPAGQKRAVIGRIVASGAGSVEEPLSKYDLVFTFSILSPKALSESDEKDYVMSLVEKTPQEKLASMLDEIANALESKGLLREAAEVDVISNTVENLAADDSKPVKSKSGFHAMLDGYSNRLKHNLVRYDLEQIVMSIASDINDNHSLDLSTKNMLLGLSMDYKNKSNLSKDDVATFIEYVKKFASNERLAAEDVSQAEVEQKIQSLKQTPDVVRAVKTLAKKLPRFLLNELLETLNRDIIGSGMRMAANDDWVRALEEKMQQKKDEFHGPHTGQIRETVSLLKTLSQSFPDHAKELENTIRFLGNLERQHDQDHVSRSAANFTKSLQAIKNSATKAGAKIEQHPITHQDDVGIAYFTIDFANGLKMEVSLHPHTSKRKTHDGALLRNTIMYGPVKNVLKLVDFDKLFDDMDVNQELYAALHEAQYSNKFVDIQNPKEIIDVIELLASIPEEKLSKIPKYARALGRFDK